MPTEPDNATLAEKVLGWRLGPDSLGDRDNPRQCWFEAAFMLLEAVPNKTGRRVGAAGRSGDER